MRYWSTGLPPSLPPPPTSPILQSQTDDEDMDGSHIRTGSTGPTRPIPLWFIDFEMPFSDNLRMCFDDFNQLFSDLVMTGTAVNPNEDTTSLLPLPNSDPVVQNGIADFDFTQFWESAKPLVDQSMSSSSDGLASDGTPAGGLGRRDRSREVGGGSTRLV
jgi:hypothetical protein